MGIHLKDLQKTPALLSAALKQAKKGRNWNISFCLDKSKAKAVYDKYIGDKAKNPVELPKKLLEPMQALADAGDWKNPQWRRLLNDCRKFASEAWRRKAAKLLEQTAAYKQMTWDSSGAQAKVKNAAEMLSVKNVELLGEAMRAAVGGAKDEALKLLARLAKEERLKEKAEVTLKALEKGGFLL